MPDMDLNTRFRVTEESVTRAINDINAGFARMEAALGGVTRAEKRAETALGKDLVEGIKAVQAKQTGFSQDLVRTGQSFALGFTVPIVSVLAVLQQFDQSLTALSASDAFERTADNMGANSEKILAALQKASAGTVAQVDLARSASRAMVLGVTDDVETFTTLMEIARDRSRVLGLSVTEAFDRIVSGIGKQEKEILDELGILVRANQSFDEYGKTIGKTAAQLTEAEKVQAFLNATIREGNKTLDRAALAARSPIEEYQAQKAALRDVVAEFQKGLIPFLTKAISLFNELPMDVRVVTMALFAFTLVAGPMLSAAGSVFKIFEIGQRAISKATLAMQSQTAATAEATVAENLLTASKVRTNVVTNLETATVARSAIARAAIAKGVSSQVAMEQGLQAALLKSQVLQGLNVQAILQEAQARRTIAAAAGVQMSRTHALNLAIASQAEVSTAATVATRGLMASMIGIAGTAAVIAAIALPLVVMLDLFRKHQIDSGEAAKRFGVDLDDLTRKLKNLREEAQEGNVSPALLEKRQFEEIILQVDQLSRKIQDLPEIKIKVESPGPIPLPFEELSSRRFKDIEASIKGITDRIKEAELTSAHAEAIQLQLADAMYQLGYSSDEVTSLLGPLIDYIESTAAAEYDAAQAAATLGTTNLATAETFNAISATIKDSLSALTAYQSLLGQIASLESVEELQIQKTIAEQQIIIANRKLEINQFGKKIDAQKESKHWAELESEAIGKQIKEIDIQIKEKELYIKTLAPPELLEEIRLLEKEVDARGKVSDEMSRHINSLSRVANGIQRQINVIERQARAVERLNKPLERQVTLLDLQARRIELTSRAARRNLEQLQKIPGISGDVIAAAQAEVDAYDKQINELTDAMDWYQLEIDTRQAVADAIRDQQDVLEDQLDLINEEIDILNDEKEAYDDTTSAIEDIIDAKNDYIDTLVPPELLQEIEQLKLLKEQLEIQKSKLELLIPAHDAVKASTGDTFDPIINNAQATVERLQTVLDKIDSLKKLGQINVLLGASLSPEFFRISVLLDALTLLSSNATKFKLFMEMMAPGPSHKSLEYIAAYFGLPSMNLLPTTPFQHGGITTVPMMGSLHPNEAVIPLNSPTGQRLLGDGRSNGSTYIVQVENWWGNDEAAIDELAHKIEARIVRKRRL